MADICHLGLWKFIYSCFTTSLNVYMIIFYHHCSIGGLFSLLVEYFPDVKFSNCATLRKSTETRECPIIKHLILSPDILWRFWHRPVREKCRKMSITLKPFGIFWQNFAYALILTRCSPRDCQMSRRCRGSNSEKVKIALSLELNGIFNKLLRKHWY